MSARFVPIAAICVREIGRFNASSWPTSSFDYIDISAVDASSKMILAARTLATDDAPSRAQSIVREGDILVSTVRPNLNAVALVPRELDGAVCSSAFAVLRCHESELAKYLYCFVQSPVFIAALSSVASGSHYPAVSDANVFDVRLPLGSGDPAVTANRISAALAEVRGAASLVTQQVQAADLLPRSALSMFFANRPPVVAGPISAAELSPSWCSQSLLSFARLESGHTPSRRRPDWWVGPVPWLALPDIRKLHGKLALETIETINDAGLANSSARLLPVGTVCLCRDASIGFVTMLGRPMATSQHFCNWICDPESLDPEFLMYAFMASFDYLRALGSGSVLKTIYMPTIQSFHISAPSIDEQRRIARTLREQLAAAEALQKRLAERQVEIERLPQRILAAAFGDAD